MDGAILWSVTAEQKDRQRDEALLEYVHARDTETHCRARLEVLMDRISLAVRLHTAGNLRVNTAGQFCDASGKDERVFVLPPHDDVREALADLKAATDRKNTTRNRAERIGVEFPID